VVATRFHAPIDSRSASSTARAHRSRPDTAVASRRSRHVQTRSPRPTAIVPMKINVRDPDMYRAVRPRCAYILGAVMNAHCRREICPASNAPVPRTRSTSSTSTRGHSRHVVMSRCSHHVQTQLSCPDAVVMSRRSCHVQTQSPRPATVVHARERKPSMYNALRPRYSYIL